MKKQEIIIPKAFSGLFEPYRYKVYYGGRGSGKSWAFADALLIKAMQRKTRILCAREFQVSIAESVHKLLADRIVAHGLDDLFEVQKATIIGKNGSEFIFKGIRHNVSEVKSMEGIDICWIEEGENTTQESLETIIPTIRKENSEIWISFNNKTPNDPVYKHFVLGQSDNALVKKVSFRDNPFFPLVLEKERLKKLAEDPEGYAHIWEGEFDTRNFGGVYSKQIDKVHKEGRIQPHIYDPLLPVHTAWDLGYDDATAIVFWQKVYNEVRVIDYYENNLESVEHYFDLIKSKPYSYGVHYVPHDAANKLLAAGGRSIVMQAAMAGIKMSVVPATSDKNNEEALRKLLDITWFEKGACDALLRCLMEYHYIWDNERKIYKSKPNHDWSSHGCDAMEIIGQVFKNDVKEIKPKKTHLTINDVFWPEHTKKQGVEFI